MDKSRSGPSGLRSTYQPSAQALAPLAPGWSEHKAPTGHTYYYNAETKVSTYTRPGAPQAVAPQTTPNAPYGSLPNLSDPKVANAYLAQLNQSQRGGSHGSRGGGRGGGRGGHEGRPKPQPTDKPRRKEAIPGCEPWILVYTKYSRRFVYNPVKNASYWRIPEKLMPGILELDKARIRGKAEGTQAKEEPAEAEKAGETADTGAQQQQAQQQERAEDSSEYEEVEVTDDEADEEEADGEHPTKRQRTEEPGDEGPVEFTEADIMAQLQAMGEDYGLEPGDYDDGNMEDWPEGAEGLDFSEEDAKLLFRDLLDDFNINPFSPWEKLMEEGKIIEDPRYTALSTTKARRECWDEWSREKINLQKELRARQEKKDPRVAYMAFLQEKATPKLYWPEFKRKYKKEAPMKDMNLSDKDREKAYRDHINRLKQPQATRKADLNALLKAQPIHVLNNKSFPVLPTQILVDARYAALEPAVRDPLIEAYVQTLGPPPDEDADDAQAALEAKEKRERREKALRDRDRAADDARRQRERDVARAKANLREEEREVEMAMRVGRDGLKSRLVDKSDA
ncbi:unnamed protein product [Clonostachys chloroleuca]|uniref:WW domain-containing protein n=1 Tax=Clonostachys chloroleuca TaxID=1926264 RepID=A0AA35VUT4_9HYPO|nr:unnamed protein product [Clonostachys chloroleuca]